MSASFPNGIASGISVNGLPLTITNPGEIFWVNSSTVLAKDGRPGATNVGASALITGKGTYRRPFATINQALDKCLANRGDIILVMPGYAETISSAGAGVTFDVAGVAVIGLGSGSLKPSFTLDTAIDADVDLTADDVILYNLRFIAAFADITHGLEITGADATVDSCEFLVSAATHGFLISIKSTNTSFGLTVSNCMINQQATFALGTEVSDDLEAAIQYDGDNTTIKNNVFQGEFTNAMIYNVTTLAEGALIIDNVGQNYNSAATGAVSLKTGATGLIMRNNFGVLESSAIAGLFINKSCGMCENYAVNVEAEAGGIVGTPST